MSKTILETIALHTKKRYEKIISEKPLEEVKAQARSMKKGGFEFENALRKKGVSFICEVKKASPSKGVIAESFPYLEIAKEYERAGADCISCLTEPKWFLGRDEYLKEIASAVSIPVLRKDFTVCEYQIYEAKLLGASAVLLICALLDTQTIKRYIDICDSLGMSALVEAHNEQEVCSAVEAGARIIGVNNRNLKDFSVDVNNSARYRSMIPNNVLFVSESGITSHSDIEGLEANETDSVLIGETLMRAEDKKCALDMLKYGYCTETKIKICGLRRQEDVDFVNELKPDFAGFILSAGYRRSISVEQARALKERLSPDIKAVGVFVDESAETINEIVSLGIIDYVQLHGNESASLCEKINAPVIKYINCEKQSAEEIKKYKADYLLFDSGTGTGKTFDWSKIPKTEKPFFLAGGISAENVREAIEKTKPYAVDASSAVEANGFKDYEKIKAFIERVRNE